MIDLKNRWHFYRVKLLPIYSWHRIVEDSVLQESLGAATSNLSRFHHDLPTTDPTGITGYG